MGGLLGGDRHPVKFLAGRQDVANPQAPVNLIQQQDAIHLILKVLQQEKFGEVFHGVYPLHPSKKEYYSAKAKELNVEPPAFDTASITKGKKISSTNTQKELEFVFRDEI
mgnify:FL=1